MKIKRKRHFYTYIVWEEGWPIMQGTRVYLGSRGCYCLPERDAYLGSCSDKTFEPKYKKIIETFLSRKEAYKHEETLQKEFDVVKNPYFANRSRVTSTFFTTEGLVLSEERKERQRVKMSGEKHFYFGMHWYTNGFNNVRSFTQPEGYFPGRTFKENLQRILKLKEAMTGKNNPMYGRKGELAPGFNKKGELNCQYGKFWWNNGSNEICSVDCPVGYVKGRIFRPKPNAKGKPKNVSEDNAMWGKIQEAHPSYGRKWYTNGIDNVFSFECPKDYWNGRTLNRNKKC